jgi:hypothetical protein
MTFDEYVALAEASWREKGWQRRGQVYFNVLAKHRPDLSEAARTTDIDPFYQTTRLDSFLEWVMENW